MALVGQIVTVSDVLMDGTVNNYIMGADANVFQTNYNSSGVMTNWSIGDDNKYLRCVETGLQGKFGDNSIQYSSFRLDQNYFRLITNVAGTPNDRPCYFIAGNTGLNNNVILGYWNGDTSNFNLERGSLVIQPFSGALYGQQVYCIASNYCYVGANNEANQIHWEDNKRPFFGLSETNYVVSNYDLQYGLGHHNHDYLQGNGSYSHLSLSFGDISLGHYISFKDVVNNHAFNPGYFSYSHSSIQGWNDVGSQGTSVHTTSTEGYLQYTDGSNNNMFYVSSAGAAVYGSAFRLNTSNILTSNNCSLISLHANGAGIGIGARGDIQMTGPMYAYSLRYAPTEGTQNIMLNALNEVILTGGSSRRLKKDITDLIDKKFNPELLYELPLKQFKYKEDPQNRDIIGFIAEEVEEFYPGASIYHYDKLHNKIIDDWEVRYIVPPMLKLIQDQHQEIETLKAEIAEIKELLKSK